MLVADDQTSTAQEILSATVEFTRYLTEEQNSVPEPYPAGPG